MECDGCLRGPDSCILRNLAEEEEPLEEAPAQQGHRHLELDVGFQQCDRSSDSQTWDLISLEKSQTWYQFQNFNCGECMYISSCDNTDAIVGLVACDDTDPNQVFGVVGGNIIPWECYVNQGSNGKETPEMFLEARCGNNQGTFAPSAKIELSSMSSDSDDHSETYWVLIPTDFSGSKDELFDV